MGRDLAVAMQPRVSSTCDARAVHHAHTIPLCAPSPAPCTPLPEVLRIELSNTECCHSCLAAFYPHPPPARARSHALAQSFCFKETAHHSSERFQAMIQGFIEVGNLIDERKKMIEAVYRKIDVTNCGHVNREEMMEFGR